MTRRRSLGWQVISWAEHHLCRGPGDLRGEPLVFDHELGAFVVRCYEVDDHGRRRYNQVLLSRPKGRSKTESAAAIGCTEALGPVRFDHWARDGEVSSWGYRFQPGEPVGRQRRRHVLPLPGDRGVAKLPHLRGHDRHARPPVGASWAPFSEARYRQHPHIHCRRRRGEAQHGRERRRKTAGVKRGRARTKSTSSSATSCARCSPSCPEISPSDRGANRGCS